MLAQGAQLVLKGKMVGGGGSSRKWNGQGRGSGAGENMCVLRNPR